jgi:drug/metabolite transporter (DMT)-like permease
MLKSIYVTYHPFKGIGFLTGRYSGGELSLMVLASAINVAWMAFATIANQLESSTYLSIFGFVSIFYALAIDLLIFNFKFQIMHLVGGSIVISVTLILALYKFQHN